MSYFYHDDEEDYYHGGAGLQGLKTTLESGKEKFTFDEESDDDDSPQFAGSFQAKNTWGGYSETVKATTKPKEQEQKQKQKPKPEKKQKISLREAFGGGEENSDSDVDKWSDDEEDIFGGSYDSDSDVSDEDIKKVTAGKTPNLNNVASISLNRYKKLHTKLDSESESDSKPKPKPKPKAKQKSKPEPDSEIEEYGGCDDFPKLSADIDNFGGNNTLVSNPFDW